MIAGIDEAGRGPVLGPMVMAIVAIKPQDEPFLKKIGVKDSKLLSEKKRNELYTIITSKFNFKILIVKPSEVDEHVLSETSSLNVLEAITSAKLINLMATNSIKKVILDLPSRNKISYLEKIKSHLKKDIELQAEFKADVNYVVVGAASILAKVTRDNEIKKMEKHLKFKIGSGYPSDHNTTTAIKNHFSELKKEKFMRMSWKTLQTVEKNRTQKTLFSFN
ncbi:MAG: ribonuclease HII [Candidatus Woesearchaeota archaeon]